MVVVELVVDAFVCFLAKKGAENRTRRTNTRTRTHIQNGRATKC